MLNIDYIHQALVKSGAFTRTNDGEGLLAEIDMVRVVSTGVRDRAGVMRLAVQFLRRGEVVSEASYESFEVGDVLEVSLSGPAFIPVHVGPGEKG